MTLRERQAMRRLSEGRVYFRPGLGFHWMTLERKGFVEWGRDIERGEDYLRPTAAGLRSIGIDLAKPQSIGTAA